MKALTRLTRARVTRLKHRIRLVWMRIRRSEHRAVGKIAVAGHLTYYGLVFVESHGLYGKAALACGVILLVEIVIGGGHGDE